jgi:hypothetical protein
MNNGGRVEGTLATALAQVALRQCAEFLVDQRQELPGGRLVAAADTLQAVGQFKIGSRRSHRPFAT